jgi:pimeloyl-ACP methyl ester carboxylesterase
MSRLLVTLLVGVAPLIGLVATRTVAAEPAESELETKPGVVFVVGGIGGLDSVGRAAMHVFPKMGLPHDVRDFVWQHGTGHFLKDLQDTDYLVDRAAELAVEVRRVKAADPDRPVYLIGKSAGAAIVLFAAEQLPPASIERMILLSAAVSANFDLRPALRATRNEVVSFHSCYDWLVLGVGTTEFGTADRVHGKSAGLYGFIKPADMTPEDAALYRRLVQVPWSIDMMSGLNLGGHQGTSMPGFLKREVSPWLR